MRGYYGIGVVGGKFASNIGTLMRSAYNFHADFIFTIGARYARMWTDTTATARHVPMFYLEHFGQLAAFRPSGCSIVGIEDCGANSLPAFVHPQRALYLLGAEDYGLSEEQLIYCDMTVAIPTNRSLNVAVAGAMVMYDRYAKETKRGPRRC